ncbi:MAG: ABC-2 family transporter protein [Planctomycetes bacterium]|nr:ABC-2 family transporter protein [Planctomycetota bacterium]
MKAALFWHATSVEARKRLTYRADFWVNALAGFAAQLGIAYFLVDALFDGSGSASIGGFSRDGMLLYYVSVVFLGKLVRSTEMEHTIAQDIYEGGLTRYLLYPAPYLVFKYAQQLGALAPLAVQIVLFGAWVPFALGLPDGLAVGPGEVAMCAAALALGNLLQFLLIWPIQTVAFWADNVWSLMVAYRILSALLGGMLVPLSLFPDPARRVLDLLPFRYLFAFPVDALLGRLTPLEWLSGMAVGLAWCAGSWALGRAVWRRGDRQYTGVGI